VAAVPSGLSLTPLRIIIKKTPGRFLVLISVRSSEEIDKSKNAMTSSGIEPATFRLVA
jgi:hypothetical protein